MNTIIEIFSKEQFKSTVDNNTGQMVVLYTAPSWCAPCRKFEPEFERLQEMTDATLVRVNLDNKDNGWVTGLQHVPTIHYYYDNVAVDDLYAMGAEAFAATLQSWE